MKNTITLLITIFFISTLLKGQTGDNSYYPPSPNASGLLKYANIPVDLYTGTPAIDLPITEIKGRQYSVPVSLSYHASGNKVQDIASWVGLGFSLNAGGVITRIVRGIPDELDNGFCGINNIGEKTYEAINPTYVQKVANGDYDSEPDLFYYNFMGHTGKFILDEQGLPVLIPYSNLVINPGICPNANSDASWTITDENGITFTFGLDAASKEISMTNSLGYTSSWYLSKITPAAGNDIQFSYAASTSPIAYTYYTQTNALLIHHSGPDGSYCTGTTGSGTTTDHTIKTTINNPVYLTQIKSSLGQIDFIRSASDRADLAGAKYLDQINVKSYAVQNPILVTSYKFNYSYFTSDGCSTEQCKRLKLESINQIGKSGGQFKLFSFEYNDLNLPSRDAHTIDHWGFYNSDMSGSKIPAVIDESSSCGGPHTGADRSADSLRSKANILTKIYRATGGYSEFIYSGHMYLDENGNNQVAGGVRIRIMKECTSETCKATYYYYNKLDNSALSSGSISLLPKYHMRNQTVSYINSGQEFVTFNNTYLVRSSQSLISLFDMNGISIGYSAVRERMPKNGYIVNLYSNFNDNIHKDISASQYIYYISSGGTGTKDRDISANEFPFTPPISLAAERGVLVNRIYYNEDSKALKNEVYNYNFDRSELKRIPAFKVGVDFIGIYQSTYTIGQYSTISKPYTLDSVTSTTYDPSDAGNETKKTTTITTYSYVPVNSSNQDIAMDLLPRKINQTLSTGDILSTENKYASDYAGAPNSTDPATNGVQVLVGAHRNPLIESITYFTKSGATKKYLTGGVLNTYKEYVATSKKVYLWEKKKLKVGAYPTMDVFSWSTNNGSFSYIPAQYKNIFTAVDYDYYGNLISSVGEDGIPITYAWSDNSTLLRSQTTNVSTPSSQNKSATYNPLIGVSTLTDQNGLTTSYTYDSYNRLMLINDVDNKITNRYRYHYQNENEALTASITVSGDKITGSSISFHAPYKTRDMASPSNYHWDFGDGSTADATNPLITTHTYNSANTYNVYLTVSNPEYGSATAALSLAVANAPHIGICANGPVKIDLCNGISPVAGSCSSGTITNNSSTTLTASTSGGCSSLSLTWQYKDNSGQWIYFSPPAPSGFTYRTVGNYTVHCIATDNCGNSITSNEIPMSIFRSTNCN